jgi:N-acetylmuramoyl-L-alanine amidase
MMIRPLFRYCLPIVLCLLAGACVTPAPRAGSTLAQWQASPNAEPRRANYVILHHTGSDSLERALGTLTSPLSNVSSHYLIDRNGRILQLVDENLRAWHAGESYWGGDMDINSASIGIELVNNGNEPFPALQIAALLDLLKDIQSRYHIPRANYLGHADIAPGRKSDPSAFFPWHQLAVAGFGMWCEPPYESPPSNFDALIGLAVLGYDTREPWKAISAFKLHFSPGDVMAGEQAMSLTDRGMLYCMVQRVMTQGRRIGSDSWHGGILKEGGSQKTKY